MVTAVLTATTLATSIDCQCVANPFQASSQATTARYQTTLSALHPPPACTTPWRQVSLVEVVATSINVPVNQSTLLPPHPIRPFITSPDDLPPNLAPASDHWVLVSYKKAKRAKSIPINTNNAPFLSKKPENTHRYLLSYSHWLHCGGKGHMARECIM